MSDEEFRQALRHAEATKDELELKKTILRMPWEFLSDFYTACVQEEAWARTKTTIISDMAPRCPCNRVGEPFCQDHQNVLSELTKAKEDYDKTPEGLRKQLASIILAQAYVDAGFPGYVEGHCRFPECAERPRSSYYCTGHNVEIPGFNFRISSARARKTTLD